MKYLATFLFACAVVHTFSVKYCSSLARRYPSGSIGENVWHFLGEIEVVFGLWASVFIAIWCLRFGSSEASHYLKTVNYTEAIFVFVIMCMAATKPVLYCAAKFIEAFARLLPIKSSLALYMSCLILGPLLGSLITEPAAMTVTAILLRDRFFDPAVALKFRYATLGLLFVNVSIGGTLTHFAAPPVLMVAEVWQWDSFFMLTHFGWRAALAIILGTLLIALWFRPEWARLDSIAAAKIKPERASLPVWIVVVQLGFMVLTIWNSHSVVFFMGVFLLFLGWCSVTSEYQDEIRIKESLLVGYFLAGLLTLGKLQEWWLAPLIANLGDQALFWGALSLTTVTDNAAVTYLGTLVPDLAASSRFMLVAGAVVGGGMTVMANAPNPVGYGLLKASFGDDGISPLGLFLGSLPFTLLAAAIFLL